MSQCGYGHEVSPCLHVCLHVSMWIWTQSVSISPCGYYIITHMDLAPCLNIITHMDLAPCLHIITHMDLAPCSHFITHKDLAPCLHIITHMDLAPCSKIKLKWIWFLTHWPYMALQDFSIINISFNLSTDFGWSVYILSLTWIWLKYCIL